MSNPTTSSYWNQTVPAVPTGDQACVIQSDGVTPQDSRTVYPKVATALLRGVVKVDASTVTIDVDGTIHAVTPANVKLGVAAVTIDGGGSVPTTGSKGFVQVPYAGTITGWTLIADASGSAAFDVKKCAFASFPTTASIVASAAPALTSAQAATSTTLTGWTTAIAAGDVLEFVLSSVTTCKRLTLELKITRA